MKGRCQRWTWIGSIRLYGSDWVGPNDRSPVLWVFVATLTIDFLTYGNMEYMNSACTGCNNYIHGVCAFSRGQSKKGPLKCYRQKDCCSKNVFKWRPKDCNVGAETMCKKFQHMFHPLYGASKGPLGYSIIRRLVPCSIAPPLLRVHRHVGISPNSTWLVTSRLHTTRPVRRVERVGTSVLSVSSRAVPSSNMADDEQAVVLACTSLAVLCSFTYTNLICSVKQIN